MVLKKILKLLSVGAVALTLAAISAQAQGLVSSGLAGSIVDEAGKPLSGATVTAVHVPTNTTYTAITSPSGRFKFSGLRVGGPYTVSAVLSG
jgi:hypothetical protein